MNASNNEKLEKPLRKFLELREKGKSSPEILSSLPEFRNEIEKIFQIVEILSRQKENIIPSPEILASIISQISIKDGVTNKEKKRYLYRGEIKGQPSILQLVDIIFSTMAKKLYLGISFIILILLIGGGYYWQSQKVAVLPIESEVSYEEKSLEQDMADLEKFSQDTSLDTLKEDLTEIAGKEIVSEVKPKIEIASIENLESELSLELSSFSTDLSALEGFESDNSLDNLESGLSQLFE